MCPQEPIVNVDLQYPSKSETCIHYLHPEPRSSFSHILDENPARRVERPCHPTQAMCGLAVATEALERSSLSLLFSVKRNVRVVDGHVCQSRSKKVLIDLHIR